MGNLIKRGVEDNIVLSNRNYSSSDRFPKRTLYYQIYNDTENFNEYFGSSISFIPYIGGDNPYSGTAIRKMSNKTFTEYTTDVMQFVGYRLPSNNFIEAYYNETFNIVSIDGSFISATSLYKDHGVLNISTIPSARYDVQSASGTFKGIEYVEIFFNNENYTRVVKLY